MNAARKDAMTAARGVMLQHRHFAFIAATIANMNANEVDRLQVALDFARACADTNPRFDRDRFLEACRPNGRGNA